MRELLFGWEEYIDLQTLKSAHLRLDCADNSEDDYIAILCEAALGHIANDIDREIYPIGQTVDPEVYPSAVAFSRPLMQATYLLIANWYENRESVVIGSGITTTKLPLAYDMLVHPYRNNGFATIFASSEGTA